MTEYNVDKTLIAFTRSYLTDCKVTVQIGNAKESKRLERGRAQDCKCVPELFLIATIDLLNILQKKHIKTFIYANNSLSVVKMSTC